LKFILSHPLKESLRLEEEICQSVSAFSNASGGLILAGVTDAGAICGIDIGKNTLEEIANYIKRNTDPAILPSVKVFDIEGKRIVVIEVKESTDKPVFFKNHAYKRVGKTNQRIQSSEMRKLAKEIGKHVYWDERICEAAKLEDINEEKLKWLLEKARLERRFDIILNISTQEALERLNLAKDGKLKNATILLLGNNPHEFFLQAEVRCARFKGTNPIDFIDMKVFNNDIISQREDALEFVKEHIKLRAEIKGTERIEKWEYPIEAIREAITNAICHRDYEIAGHIQIRIFDDRLEVWGCGPLPEPLTPADLATKHKSVLRNPLIGKCFFLIKYIEEWGTGTNRIIDACVRHGLPEPIFEYIVGDFVVTFRKYNITDEMLNDLNLRQRNAVEYLLKQRKITNKEYRQLNPGITDRTVLNDFNELIEKNIITAKGEKKYRYYTLR
jgi:ATP-dependent DNA helicase RecG